MDAIGPGDWVECCIPADWRGDTDPGRGGCQCRGPYPYQGSVHQVRAVGDYMSSRYERQPGLRLEGTIVSAPGHPDMWFNARCFRLRKRPWSEWLNAAPADAERTPEPAQ